MNAAPISEPVGEQWHGLAAYRVRQEFDEVCALYGCPGVPSEALRVVEDGSSSIVFAFTHLEDMLHVVVNANDLIRDPDLTTSHIVSDLVCALRELHRADAVVHPVRAAAALTSHGRRPAMPSRTFWPLMLGAFGAAVLAAYCA